MLYTFLLDKGLKQVTIIGYREAITSYYLGQYQRRSMVLFGVTKAQRVNFNTFLFIKVAEIW